MPGPIDTVLFEIEGRPKLDAADAAVNALDKKITKLSAGSDIEIDAKVNAAGIDAVGAKIDALKGKATAAGAGLGDALNPPAKGGLIEKLEADLKTFTEQKKKAFTVEEAAGFEKEIKRTENELESLNKQITKASGSGGNILDKVKSGFKEGSKDILNFAAGGLITGGVTAAADLAVQGITKVIEIGSKFQTGMADLEAITGVSGAALKGLGNDARDMAKEFGTSASDQIESYKGILSRLGPDIASVPEALKKITTDVNILSKATGDDAAASMDALTTAALQFGTDLSDPAAAAEDITKKMNTMAAGAKVGAAEVPQVAEALKQMGVAASSANLSFEESNAAIQVLAAGGKVGSEAGVAIRNVIGLIQKQSSEGNAALKSMGIGASELGELLTTKGLGPALEKLQTGLKGVGSDAERNKTLITLFGQESSAAAGILLRNTDQLSSFTAGVTDTNTAFEQAAIRQQTFQERIAKVGAFFEDVGITVFQAVGDAIGFVADNFELVAGVLVPVSVPVIELVKHFGELKDTAGSVIDAVGGFFGLISDVDQANDSAGRSTNAAARAFEDYQDKIGKVDAALSSADGIDKQVGRLAVLQDKTNLTANEQKELAKLTGDLGDKFPEATSGVNELTGAYQVNLSKLKDLSVAEREAASADKKALIEENLIGPTKDMLPALDAQKAKLAELRTSLDDAIKSGDKDKILEARDAYTKQREEMSKTKGQLDKNIEALVKSGTVGKGSAEEIAKALGISRAEAEKLVPKIQAVNTELKNQADEAKKAGESLEGLGKKFDEAMTAASAALKSGESGLAELIQQRRSAQAAGDDEQIKSINNRIRLESQGLKTIHGNIVQDQKDLLAAKQLAGDVTAKAGESEFQLKMKALKVEQDTLSAASASAEAEINSTAINAFLAGTRKKAELTKRENEIITKQRISDLATQEAFLRSQVLKFDATGDNVIGLKVRSKKGEEQKDLASATEQFKKLGLEIAKAQLDLVKLKPVLTEDELAKAAADVAASLDAFKFKEIEIGVRPKEDTLSIIDDQIGRIQDEIKRNEKKLSIEVGTTNRPDEIAKLQQVLNQLNTELLAKQTESGNQIRTLDKELFDSRIDLIKNDVDRERLALGQKLSDFEAYWDARIASGQVLSDREIELKLNGERKFYNDLLALDAKANEDKFAAANSWTDKLSGLFTAAMADQKHISKEEVDDKLLSFDKEREGLDKSLRKGQIATAEYNVKLAKLTKDRAAFEDEQNSGTSSKFVLGLKGSYNAAVEEAGKYFSTLAFKYIADELLSSTAENIKTATTAAGSAARIAAMEDEIIKLRELLAVKTGDAAAGAAASAASVIPFPFNIVAAIAAGTAVSLGIQALVKSIKFETGGLGLVGERGPEIIGPTKDFSQFATQLVLATARQTANALGADTATSGSRRSGRRDGIDVRFRELTITGRSLKNVAEREVLANQNERIVSN
jgi:TP901 family phage tail tape measure protein